MSSVAIGVLLVVDIMPFVYKITQIISDTEFIVINTYQNTEHQVQNIGNSGWKFTGVSLPHNFYFVDSTPISNFPITISQVPVINYLNPLARALIQSTPISTPQLVTRPVVLRFATATLGPQALLGINSPTIPNTPLPNINQTMTLPRPTINVVPNPQPTTNPAQIITQQMMARRNVLSYGEWMDYVENNNFVVDWDQLENLPDDTVIIAGIENLPPRLNRGVVEPEAYFRTRISRLGDIDRQFFYEYRGFATLPDVGPIILRDDLIRTPYINTDASRR